MAFVYRHIRLDKNVPFYIGISKKNSPSFARAKVKSLKHRNNYWHNVNNTTKIRVEILFEDVTYEFAKQKEIELIELYGRVRDGGTLVNLTKGGDGVLGFKNPKLSERNKTGIWKGRKHTEAHKKMMSEKYKGRTFSESHLKNMRDGFKKRQFASFRNPKWRGFFYVYNSSDGTLVGKYNSMVEGCEDLKLSQGNVTKRLQYKGKGKKRGGYYQYNFIRTKENLLF